MRKLSYILDLNELRRIKKEIVPAIFTEHQFSLIEKKALGRQMTLSEKNEFSRTVSRKMRAINKMQKREQGLFVYGIEVMRKDRLEQAASYLKTLSRRFKNKHIIITGSFLYKEKYNDIDVMIISDYEKEEQKQGNFHISYFTKDFYCSLLMLSIKKMCISNKEIKESELKEEVNIDTFISLYQELFNDLSKNLNIKQTLRGFLLQASLIGKLPIPNSADLDASIASIIKIKNPENIIKNIFVNAVALGVEKTKAIDEMKAMIKAYDEISEEYPQHKKHYEEIAEAFKEVIDVES